MVAEVPDWKDFEIAVARFVAAIANGAKVTHDMVRPDADTGQPRQRDVWVEWSIGGHFPFKALISCKYVNTPLDQLDIDHFNGEFISSKAHMGIVYARRGFNRFAVEKAKALGFHCCKLYRDEPAELPAHIFGEVYHFHPSCQIGMRGEDEECKFKYWKDVFEMPVNDSTVLEQLAKEFDQFQRFTTLKESWRKAKEGHVGKVTVQRSGLAPIEITIRSFYRIYRGKIEYTMLNGSYNVTEGDFSGTQAFPVIDSQSAHPGPGWELIDTISEDVPVKCIMSFASGNSVKHLREYGETRLPPLSPDVA